MYKKDLPSGSKMMSEIKKENEIFAENPLLPKDEIKYKKPGLFGRFRNFFKKLLNKANMVSRTVYLNGNTIPEVFPSNTLNNQKYNIITFIPVVLFNQFKQFYNLFFLMICISQMIPDLRIGFIATYITPLAFVLSITLSKEFYDDWLRRKRDSEMNSEKYQKLTEEGNFIEINSSDINVGDIILLHEKRRIPADVILLHTTEKGGAVFIKTDQLDGETDWKLRKAVPKTQALLSNESRKSLFKINAFVKAEAPHRDIYKFQGIFSFPQNGNIDENEGKETYLNNIGLELENTMWASTVLAMGVALGLVIYTGRETKSQLNMRDPRTKSGKIDKEISLLSMFLFGILFGVAILLVILNGLQHNWPVLLMRFVLLLSYIIPISLRVNLDLAKAWYSFLISRDEQIPETIARSTTIPEELGRIQVLFSDKTGTLTQNEMEFKSLIIDGARFDLKESGEELKTKMLELCKDGPDPLSEFVGMFPGRKSLKRFSKDSLIKDLIYTLALCHNVTPVQSSQGKIEYQASSPDEVALAKFAELMNFQLIDRDQTTLTLKNPTGCIEKFEILLDFPFTSDSKRMGIILKHQQTKRIMFLLKGAEQIIAEKVDQDSASKMREAAELLSMEGLRTLSFACKVLQPTEYEEWRKKYDEACAAEENRNYKKNEIRNILEENMNYIGVTGVEGNFIKKI